MANISTALGTIQFNFSETTLKQSEMVDFIKKFFNFTQYGEFQIEDDSITLDYATIPSAGFLNKISDYKNLNNEKNIFSIPFEGFGRWNYRSNLSSLVSDKAFASFVKNIEGLEIIFDYSDFEQGNGVNGSGYFHFIIEDCELDLITNDFENDGSAEVF